MENNNKPKSKKKIFIIWGLFISGVILVLLMLLLLAINKPQPKIEKLNQQHLKSNINAEQEQETYNRLMNKIEKEVDKLTQQQEQTPSLKYPPKTYYQNDGIKIRNIQEHNQNTGIIKKSTHFYDDGKTIRKINEYNDFNLIKETYYNQDGTIKETKTF